MYEIELMENVLGHSYGRVPRILENTKATRFLEHIKKRRYFPTSFVSGLIISLLRGGGRRCL